MATTRGRRRRSRNTDRVQDVLARTIMGMTKERGNKFQSGMAALVASAYGEDKTKHPSRAAVTRAFDRLTTEGGVKVSNPSHGVYEFEVINPKKVTANGSKQPSLPMPEVVAAVEVQAESVVTPIQAAVDKLFAERAAHEQAIVNIDKDLGTISGKLTEMATTVQSRLAPAAA